jgi:hypothetical protein
VGDEAHGISRGTRIDALIVCRPRDASLERTGRIRGDRGTDLLIRDVPEEVSAAIDAKARRAGVSRSEYLRRTLVRESATTPGEVTVGDLARFAETFADLADDDVMRQAWE